MSLAALRQATRAPERRSGLDTPPTPARLTAAVPAWSSRATMLRVIRALATQPYTAELCRLAQLSIDTWVAVATNDALDADHATGHGMRTSQVVAAARVGRSTRTVRRARAVSVKLGILVELYRGRELSGDERRQLLDEKPGHRQRGMPNVYAVTVCPPRQRRRISVPRPGRHALVDSHDEGFVHLPPVGRHSSLTHLLDILPWAAASASGTAEPAPPARRRRRALPGVALAYSVMQNDELRTLFADVRPGQARALFAPYEAGGWSGPGLAAALRSEVDRMGIPTWMPARSPFGLLRVLLRPFEPDAKLFYRLGLDESATADVEPCGSPDCDGYGWIYVLVDDVEHAAECPSCAPAVRRGDTTQRVN